MRSTLHTDIQPRKINSNMMARIGGGFVLALAFSVINAAKADAALMAYICDDIACSGGNDLVATDGGAGDVLFGAVPGVISFGGTLAGYEVLVNTSQSKPAISTGMDITYTVTDTGGGTGGSVWIYATDTDFAGPAALTGNDDGNGTNGFVTAIICGGNNNDPRDPVNTGPCTTATDNSVADVDITLNHFASANPYSLTIGVEVNVLGGSSTGNYSVDAAVVPEPASLALLGSGLLGLGFRVRKRLQKKN